MEKIKENQNFQVRLKKIEKAIKISKYNFYISSIALLTSSGFVLKGCFSMITNNLSQEEKELYLKELIPAFTSFGSFDILCLISTLMLACTIHRKDSIRKVIENNSIKEDETIPINKVLQKSISNQYSTTKSYEK